MPKLPIFRLRPTEAPPPPDLRRYKPVLSFTDLQLGVDNLRYDVFLGARFTADLSSHLSKYICRFGEVETLFDMDVPSWTQCKFIRPAEATDTNLRKRGPADLKTVLISIHQAILTHAKAQGNSSIDLLGRLAVLKFIRAELNAQFSKILEQCRTKSKAMEGVRQAKMMETQELCLLLPGPQENHHSPRRPGSLAPPPRNRKRGRSHALAARFSGTPLPTAISSSKTRSSSPKMDATTI